MHTDNSSHASSTPHVRVKDALALLRADHEEVSALFADVEQARSAPRKKDIVAKICAVLSVHVQIEEEIFYPAVQEALKDKLLVPEAKVEHNGVKALIAQLAEVDPDAEMYDARIKVLSEYVKHHVREEQTEMFPRVRASSLDLVALGERMAARKAALLAGASSPLVSP